MKDYLNADTLTAVAAFGAMVAALANLWQGRIAARTNAAQIYLAFCNRYNAPEIATALRALAAWRKKQGDDFAEQFYAGVMSHDPIMLDIDLHRRTLNRYFLDVARAYRARVLNKHLARLAADHPGASVFRHIVVPLNVTLYDKAGLNALEILERLVPNFGKKGVF